MTEGSTNSDWWYVANGQNNGPVSDRDLQSLLTAGALEPDALVWKPGMEAWQPLSQVEVLSGILTSASSAQPAAQPAAAPGVAEPAGGGAAIKRKGLDKWKHVFLTFRERIDRETFWLANFLLYLVAAAVSLIGILIISFTETSGSYTVSYLGLGVVGLIVVVGFVAIAAKRLHDFNRSGWWVLAYFILTLFSSLQFLPTAVQILGSLAALLVFIAIGAVRGTVGPNAYGPDPHWRAHLE